ncbi:MAG: MtnX-like HAD-IB family phosphatase [Candidatus Omnitrophica bacterium]|nr:MtnX-like HAD-IB family phosphatase [Candidatus Omnitrophota bacterium]
MTLANKGVLVSDFDGTITRFDFYDLICREFPSIARDYWQQYEAGQITHFEALRLIFAGIRTSEPKLFQIVESMQICSQIKPCVTSLRQVGWDVVVASAGCDWYIKRLLDAQGVSITVHANPGIFSPETGLIVRFPEPSVFFSQELGVNKVAVVREAIKTGGRVAFAGDGRPDLAPALLVPPNRRFAKSWLAKKLHEIGEKFRPFDDWSEVAHTLVKESAL